MPEGPEIRRAADAIESAIGRQQITDILFAHAPLKPWRKKLAGRQVRCIETRGKAMLTRLEGGVNIYSHNQLYGRWYCVAPGDLPETKRQLRLAIHTCKASALLYSASDIAVIKDAGLPAHPLLQRLGPDVLHADTEADQVMRLLQSKNWCRRQLGSILTDQSLVAGLGNYLRCEILFLTSLHPRQRVQDLDQAQVQRLADAMLALPRQSYRTAGITNDEQRAAALMRRGAGFEDARFYVYRRGGLPCYRCGAPIQRLSGGGQHCYLCPVCQAA